MSSDAWAPPIGTSSPEVSPDQDLGVGPGLFVDLWLAPRATVRTVLDHGGRYGVLPLAALTGFGSLDLDGPVEEPFWKAAVVGLVLAAPLFGIIGVYVEAFVVWISATFLGHAVNARDLVVALAWGRLPTTVMGLPTALVSVLYVLGLIPEAIAVPILVGTFAVGALGWVWSWFTLTQAVGEVLGASAWRGLAVYALPYVAVLGLVLVIAVAVLIA